MKVFVILSVALPPDGSHCQILNEAIEFPEGTTRSEVYQHACLVLGLRRNNYKLYHFSAEREEL